MNTYRKYLPPAALIGGAAVLSLFATLMLRRASKPESEPPVLLADDAETPFVGPPNAFGHR